MTRHIKLTTCTTPSRAKNKIWRGRWFDMTLRWLIISIRKTTGSVHSCLYWDKGCTIILAWSGSMSLGAPRWHCFSKRGLVSLWGNWLQTVLVWISCTLIMHQMNIRQNHIAVCGEVCSSWGIFKLSVGNNWQRRVNREDPQYIMIFSKYLNVLILLVLLCVHYCFATLLCFVCWTNLELGYAW